MSTVWLIVVLVVLAAVPPAGAPPTRLDGPALLKLCRMAVAMVEGKAVAPTRAISVTYSFVLGRPRGRPVGLVISLLLGRGYPV
jgi:hypothetical protein